MATARGVSFFLRLAFSIALASAGTGCLHTPTWPVHAPGSGLPPDRVVLVGSFVSAPPIEQYGNGPVGAARPAMNSAGAVIPGRMEPRGHLHLFGDQVGHVGAIFTPDRSEPWGDGVAIPFSQWDWTWLPFTGAFAVEVPRQDRLHLRGFFYLTDGGGVRFEAPGELELRKDDRVVYVGEIRVTQADANKVIFSDKSAETRKALQASGFDDLAKVRWRTRVFRAPK